MKPRIALAVVALVSLVAVTVVAQPPSRPAKATPPADVLARGRYLTTIAGCQDCHTPGFFYGAPDATRQLSGSELGWSGPWGTTYSANLTPDRATGLGAWTDAQIVTALREGVRPDGSALRPPMPWQNFAALTDDDARAIVAYLRSVPAVKHQEPAAQPPGARPTGAVVVLPPPPAWDAPKQTATR